MNEDGEVRIPDNETPSPAFCGSVITLVNIGITMSYLYCFIKVIAPIKFWIFHVAINLLLAVILKIKRINNWGNAFLVCSLLVVLLGPAALFLQCFSKL